MAQLLYFVLILWLSSEIKTALSKSVAKGLKNQHLIITGEYWEPFLYFNYDANATTSSYGGIMWDLLLFMQKARNFTFTMAMGAEKDVYETWGQCYQVNNCTGMIGKLNRGEVDVALGNQNLKFETYECKIMRILLIRIL